MIIRYRGAQHINIITLVPIQGQTFAWNILSTLQSRSEVAVETVHVKTADADVVLGAVLISARSSGAVSTV